MKSKKKLILLLAAIISFTIVTARAACAQEAKADKAYQQMSQAERTSFVAAEARRVARLMSGAEYNFTPGFAAEIQKAVDAYAQRIGNGGGDRLWKGDARFVFERGQAQAPMLINAFKAHNLSPLMGLYIPLIESEYENIQTPNVVGALGMFQFIPKTATRFGLTASDLLNAEKSADAAARYIAKNMERFKQDRMKEALALLAYNRGEQAVERDLALLVNDRRNACSICELTSQRDKMDANFQNENVYYVPRFFAAAIIGENPQAFGLQLQPLSSYELKN